MTDRRNSIWLSVQFMVTILVSLITLKINILNYGENDFGVWIVLVAIWSFNMTLDFGIGTTVVKFIAQYKSEKQEKINSFISTSFGVFIIVGLLLVLIGYFAAEVLYFSNSNVIPPERKSYFVLAFKFYSIAFIMQYLTFFYKSIFEGLNNFVTSSKFVILQNMIVFAGILIIWIMKCSLIYLSVVYVAAYSTILLLFVFKLKKKHPEIRIGLRHFNKSMLKEILSFSISIQTINVFNNLIDVVIKNIIANHFQAGYATTYETARRFAVAISGLFFNAFKFILPKVSALKKDEEINLFLKSNIIEYTKYGLAYSGLAFGIMAFPLLVIIQLFFEKQQIMATFLILAMPEVVNNGGYCIYNYILGRGKVQLLALIQFNNLILTTAGAMVGFALFKSPAGLLGYFISVTLGNILMLFHLQKVHKLEILTILKEVRVYKLFIFELMLLISMFFVSAEIMNIYVLFGLISFISIIIYGKDIFFYLSIFCKNYLEEKKKNQLAAGI